MHVGPITFNYVHWISPVIPNLFMNEDHYNMFQYPAVPNPQTRPHTLIK